MLASTPHLIYDSCVMQRFTCRRSTDARILQNHITRSVSGCYQRTCLPRPREGVLSLHDIASEPHEDITLHFSQFLDDFRHTSDKQALIEDEPQWDLETAGRWYYDFAATAHKLANDNGLPVPQWCLKEKYFASKPYYAFDTKDPGFQGFLEQNTPEKFCQHGLYLGPNVLSRL